MTSGDRIAGRRNKRKNKPFSKFIFRFFVRIGYQHQIGLVIFGSSVKFVRWGDIFGKWDSLIRVS